jgi:hypothetical protein
LCQREGQPVKDLHELLKISTESHRRNAKVIGNVMRFLMLRSAFDVFPIKRSAANAYGRTTTPARTVRAIVSTHKKSYRASML